MLTHKKISPLLSNISIPTSLYTSKQVYKMEQNWFEQGFDSFALMQQAAWQISQYIRQIIHQKRQLSINNDEMFCGENRQLRACIWVGRGNNGGDGWLVAHYLQQAGWHVKVVMIATDKQDVENDSISDATKAKNVALAAHCSYEYFESSTHNNELSNQKNDIEQDNNFDVYVDALFGIGLDRAPDDIYKRAITAFNKIAEHSKALVVSIDIPSGLVASTGHVFQYSAIYADITLCLIARKFGLHTKDGMDHAGHIIDLPLIPHASIKPVATLLSSAYCLSSRRKNSYKGSYGHVLIIGGNRIDGSKGMGGAAILAASSAMATGAGKITVACHQAFHGALLTSLPDAMTIDLHDKDGVNALIEEASVVAIGMGLGRDKTAELLFISYLQTAMAQDKSIVIDADGLYHLALLQKDGHELITSLRIYSQSHQICLTPHSGEAAHLLDKKITEVEFDRLATIKQCADIYGGDWVLKGAGSLVLEQVAKQENIYICGAGNAGMASAGMGDVLSGITAGLIAQQDLNQEQRSLRQAVLIHGMSGDLLTDKRLDEFNNQSSLLIGQRGLQAQDMPLAIRHIMASLIS